MNGNDALLNSRAEMRRLKLQEAEREQQAEELEALKITEEQMNILKRPFRNVKFEFWDLDGLHWAGSRQSQPAIPVGRHADATPAMASASTSALPDKPSHPAASAPSGLPKPALSTQKVECIDLTQPTPSVSLSEDDAQDTIRVKASKPRTRKPLSRVYSSNDIQLENVVPVPTLGAHGHCTPGSSTSTNGISSSAEGPSNSSGSENQPSPQTTSRSRPATRSRALESVIAFTNSIKSIRASKGTESGTGAGVGLGLRVKEPGSPGPMRDLDFNSNFNSSFSPSEFGTSSFLSSSDLSASLSSSTSTSSTPPTPRFGMFDSFDSFDSPGDFEFDDQRDAALGVDKRGGSKDENDGGYFGLSAMELYNSLIADERAFRAAAKTSDAKLSMPAWCTPRRDLPGAKGLSDIYEKLKAKQEEEYLALGPEEWARRQEQRRLVQPMHVPKARKGRDVYSVGSGQSSDSKAAMALSMGIASAGKARGCGAKSLMDTYAAILEERDAARAQAGKTVCSSSPIGPKAQERGSAYMSPDMAYEEMLQDNSAMYFGVGVGRGVYDLTPANSCPPSPVPERYEFVF